MRSPSIRLPNHGRIRNFGKGFIIGFRGLPSHSRAEGQSIGTGCGDGASDLQQILRLADAFNIQTTEA